MVTPKTSGNLRIFHGMRFCPRQLSLWVASSWCMWGALGFVQMFVQRSWILCNFGAFFLWKSTISEFFFPLFCGSLLLWIEFGHCDSRALHTKWDQLCPLCLPKTAFVQNKTWQRCTFLTLTDDMLGCLLVPNSGYPKMRIAWIPPSNDEVYILLLPLLPIQLNSSPTIWDNLHLIASLGSRSFPMSGSMFVDV